MLAIDISGIDGDRSLPVDSWQECPTGWAVPGHGSAIVPFRHPALEEIAVSCGDQLLVAVRERRRGCRWPRREQPTPYPVDAAGWRRLLDELQAWPLQVVSVVVGPHQVSLRSGRWGTAPVYLTAGPDGIHGHWDPVRLYRYLPDLPRLDPVLAAHFLATFDTPYSARTVVDGLSLLTQGSLARWDVGDGRLRVEYPAEREPPPEHRLNRDADVLGGVWRCLTSVVDRWPGTDRPGCELSGGLDSALVAAAVCATAGGAVSEHAAAPVGTGPAGLDSSAGLHSYGLELPGAAGTRQRDRRRAVAERLGAADHPLSFEGLEPFSTGGAGSGREPAVPWEGCYAEAMTALLRTAAADGVRVLFTGIGGDELCYPRSLRSVRSRAGTGRAPDFLTPEAVAAAREVDRVVRAAPAGPALASVVQAAAVSSSCYLRHGIWPVHPLSAPELVELCARLPAAWRQDRRLSRLLLTQHGFPARVVDAGETDDFTPVLARGLRRAWPEHLAGLWSDSRLADLGWVDPGRLVAGFDRWAAGGATEEVVPFYAAVVLERTVRALESRSGGSRGQHTGRGGSFGR